MDQLILHRNPPNCQRTALLHSVITVTARNFYLYEHSNAFWFNLKNLFLSILICCS